MKNNEFKIFLFHGVIKKDENKIRNYTRKHVLEKNFYKFLKDLKKKHVFLSIDDLCFHVQNKIQLPKNSISISFDDGFENNYNVAAPILDDLKIPTTFYFSTDFIENNSISWIDKLEFCLEKKKSGEIYLPWDKKKNHFSNVKNKIQLLKTIRKNVKNNFNINIDNFVSSFFDQMNIKEPIKLYSSIDKKLNWKQVKKLNNNKLFTVGGHSHNHVSLGSLTKKNLEYEISKSFSLFRNNANLTLKHYSYPEGMIFDFNKDIIKKLKKRGVVSCPTAIKGINNLATDLFKLKRIMVS